MSVEHALRDRVTRPSARRLADSVEALAVARALAEEFRGDAARRDRQRELPVAEIDQLSQEGLFALTVPRAHGGIGAPPSVVAEVLRVLAAADPNIAQIPHSHFVYVNLVTVAGTARQQEFFYQELLDGARFANAQSERGGATVADISTTLTSGPGGLRLDGTKFYCTGTAFAHWIPVLARQGPGGAEVIVFVPADSVGVSVVDDWNGLGQRTTASGTVVFESVRVQPQWVFPRHVVFDAPTSYGAFAQLLHAAIDVGIARAALQDAAEFVRSTARPWFEAQVRRADEDPLVVYRFGELTAEVLAAEALLTAAGGATDTAFAHPGEDSATAASVAVAAAKVVADKAAVTVSSALFEVGGTRSADAALNLDRHWRNARTHTLHDPRRWKYHHLGRHTLGGTPPPRHGLI